MTTTQDHLSITDIQDGIVLLKDGGSTIILKVSAVNFGLLSPEEQIAIIEAFAQMLNSLSFMIQIMILSKRLDISSYLKLLDQALSLQTNPLLSTMMTHYRRFIESLIKDNEVLDKSFYLAIPCSYLEMGIKVGSKEDQLRKSQTILIPRAEQMIRLLSRIGLKADPLNTKELIQLFYDIYNPPKELEMPPKTETIPVARLNLNQVAANKSSAPVPPAQMPPLQPETQHSKNHPFVVEELVDTP